MEDDRVKLYDEYDVINMVFEAEYKYIKLVRNIIINLEIILCLIVCISLVVSIFVEGMWYYILKGIWLTTWIVLLFICFYNMLFIEKKINDINIENRKMIK